MSASELSQTDLRIDDAVRGAQIGNEELEALGVALEAASLPADDISAPDVRPFRFTRNRKAVGHGALELHGSDVLLRLILVAADARGEGVGRRIVAWRLAYAGRKGARQAFLFTTNAGAFFEKLGFETINRSRAPRSIMATRQAVGLCPASATLLTCAVTASILEAEPFHHEREP